MRTDVRAYVQMCMSVSESFHLNFGCTCSIFTTLSIHTTTLKNISTIINIIMAAVRTFSLTHLLMAKINEQLGIVM